MGFFTFLIEIWLWGASICFHILWAFCGPNFYLFKVGFYVIQTNDLCAHMSSQRPSITSCHPTGPFGHTSISFLSFLYPLSLQPSYSSYPFGSADVNIIN